MKTLTPYILLILAALFWGGNYITGRLLVAQMNPFVLTEVRWALTSVLLLVLYHKKIMHDLEKIKQSFLLITTFAILGQLIFPLTLYIGLQYTSSLNAAIYLSTTPCATLILNKLLFQDTISRNNAIGVTISTFGALYLILQGDIANLKTLNINQGDIWTILSAISWAFYCSLLRKKDNTINNNAFVTVCSILGTLILLPFTLIVIYPTNLESINITQYLTPLYIFGIGYIAIFASWLSYAFWAKGVAEIGATKGVIFTHITPLSAGLLSIVFLHTPLESHHIISALLIITGIYLCTKKQ